MPQNGRRHRVGGGKLSDRDVPGLVYELKGALPDPDYAPAFPPQSIRFSGVA